MEVIDRDLAWNGVHWLALCPRQKKKRKNYGREGDDELETWEFITRQGAWRRLLEGSGNIVEWPRTVKLPVKVIASSRPMDPLVDISSGLANGSSCNVPLDKAVRPDFPPRKGKKN